MINLLTFYTLEDVPMVYYYFLLENNFKTKNVYYKI